jgi:transcriptional regulator with XRE-family HTH domain
MQTHTEELELGINRGIGRKLYEVRSAAGLDRHQLAKKIDVSGPQLTKYENGTNQISIVKLILIAEALSLDLDYFFKDIKPVKWDEKTAENRSFYLDVSNNFMQIKDKVCQKILSDLLKLLAKK